MRTKRSFRAYSIVACVAGLAACAGNAGDGASGGVNSQVGPAPGATAGAVAPGGMPGTDPTATGGPTAGGAAPAPGSGPGAPGSEPTAPGTEPTTPGVDPTVPGDDPATPGLIACTSEPDQLGPCGSYTTFYGVDIPLGPYGASMEYNVGQGFESAVALGDGDGGATCSLFAGTFAADPAATAKLLDTKDLDFALYTVYRPANWIEGETYPLLAWGNGTCAQPEGYGALLRYVASYGFIVVAANSRWVGGNGAMGKALDYMLSENDNPSSLYYQRVDTANVGAMGHSQGSAATATLASDPRVKAVILFNGGTSAPKPFLAISADKDIGGVTVAAMQSGVNGAPKAAFMFFHMIPTTIGPNNAPTGGLAGHLMMMMQPERVVDAATAWWLYRFKGDAASRDMFVGTSCGLCGRAGEFEYGQKGLD